MPRIRILTESDLRGLIDLTPELVEAVAEAFRALATGRVVMPPVLSMEIADHHGEVDVKTAYVPGLEGFAIKVSPGFFDNPAIGLPSTSGLMMVFSARTGQVQALLLDNGYLTDLRTAAAGAVAAQALARPDAAHACILGAGLQARMQLRALTLVRPIARASIWARDGAKARAMADEMSAQLELPVRAVDDPEQAVSAADIVVTTTPATRPILHADWLRPGQHVTAMGSDQPGKNEVDPRALARLRYVADRLSQTRQMGELRAALEAGLVARDADFPELGAVLAGTAPGRQSAEEITLADLTGTGVQDTAIAMLTLQKAGQAGVVIDS
ncbi:MAG: ectoine utilization protein EutC [Rhodobacteraceae bacterium HLUCCA12]|nr:MAG: ectoine utilization protein EutC [Rhodobacteraceae bacterium HLUCCA12]